jgi:hypothetical protein
MSARIRDLHAPLGGTKRTGVDLIACRTLATAVEHCAKINASRACPALKVPA